MKRAQSTDILEESLEISQKQYHNKGKQQLLQKSFSEDLPNFESEELPTFPPSTDKIKSRSRLTSAFRSLRGSKSSRKKASSTSAITKFGREASVLSEEESVEKRKRFDIEKLRLSPKDIKKKSKLSKKFSLSSIKKQKGNSNRVNLQHILVSSSTQTPSSLQRHTPEGGNLSISEISLADLPSDTEEPTSPVKFEKVRKIQITISGKKIERAQTDPLATTTSITEEDYLSVSPRPPSGETIEKSNHRNEENKTTVPDADSRHHQGKISVTESTRDTPPRERAPARPDISPSKRDSSQVEHQFPARAPIDGAKGAIKKTLPGKLQRQKSREDYIEVVQLMQHESKFERGRRFPRPAAIDHSSLPESQQIVTPEVGSRQQLDSSPLGGNNIHNPNLSGCIADQQPDSSESHLEHKIEFSVGKAVRPPKPSILSQTSADSKEYSSFGSNKSSGSQSPVSEGSVARRRIRYIDQPTLYTDEEREILEGKREALGHLSGISEYSFDSEFSADTQMPAFGDLTMDHEEAPIMTSPSSEKREHLYKILVIGELGTGKTSFIKRYVHQFFSQNYRATIGVDFALKVLHWDQNTIVRLQLWDIAGQERFGNMTRVYYKEAVGAFIVFDVTRSGTFDCVSKWKEDLDSKVQLPDGSPIPCILLANKCDQEKQGIVTNPEKMDEYVREKGFAGWFETSAKENINIEEAARALVNKILLNDKLISAADIMDNDKFALAGGSGSGSTLHTKKSCSC